MMDIKIQATVRGYVHTLYVNIEGRRVFLGGDYLEITKDLTQQEMEKLVARAKRKAG